VAAKQKALFEVRRILFEREMFRIDNNVMHKSKFEDATTVTGELVHCFRAQGVSEANVLKIVLLFKREYLEVQLHSSK